MSQYNLTRNAYFDALTTSGTGNVSLTWAELEKLMDGNTTSSGIDITSSGILLLETDLSQRIKVDEIRLYASDLAQAAHVDFYYKNESGDSYTHLTTQAGSYYYATISDPSAPRYIRAVVSGVAITLYEFEVINDDYIVAFGEDGTLYAEYLDNTPIGEEGTPQAVAIYNNGTSAIAADAYVCIDYTGEVADEYVKISANENGTYYGIDDGILIDDNQVDSEYRWAMTPSSISASMISSDDVKNFGKLISLPTITKTNFTNTAENCWDYDSFNNKLYVAASDSTIKLYELDVNSSVWTYLGELNPGGSDHSTHISIGYLSGYVYANCNATTTGSTFGRFDLSTNVWTTLASPSAGASAALKYNMCSDYNRYLYLNKALTDKSGTKYFGRYDTVSNTWASLSVGYRWYGLSGGSFSNFHMWYDTNRGRLYAITGEVDQANGENRYIQIYYPSTDSWADLLYVYTFASNPSTWAFAYDNVSDFIWMMFDTKPNLIYRYSLVSAELTSYQINYSFPSLGADYSAHMIAIPVMSGVSSVLIGNVSADRSYVYHYQAVGKYYTPVFELEEINNSSYFLINGTTVSGLGSISYDAESYNGTIRIRSSNTAPLTVNELYFTKSGPSSYVYLDQWKPYPNEVTSNYLLVQAEVYNGGGCFIDRRTGYYAVTYLRYFAPFNYGKIEIINRSGVEQWRADSGDYLYYYHFCAFDHVGGIWGYNQTNSTGYRLHHFNYFGSIIATIYDGTDFLYDLAVEWDGDGVWYTDKINDLLRHRNNVGTLLQSIVLPQPRSICSTTDNGCWVIDNVDLNAYRYTFSGTLSQTVSIGRPATRMTYDYYDGFWYIYGDHVYHVTAAGVNDVDVLFVGVNRLVSTMDGCVAYNGSTASVRFIDYDAKAITRTWTSSTYNFVPGVFSLNNDLLSENPGLDAYNLLPASYDSVWGTSSGSLAWQEVKKDGYFLPKTKYHQVEVTLRGNATLEQIVMSPAIKIQDIDSQTYKYMYVKTNIPVGASVTNHEARIKTWWGVDE